MTTTTLSPGDHIIAVTGRIDYDDTGIVASVAPDGTVTVGWDSGVQSDVPPIPLVGELRRVEPCSASDRALALSYAQDDDPRYPRRQI